MPRLTAVLALAAGLALPAFAQAATPFTAGVGKDPRIAVSDDGTGHVVWTVDGTPDSAMYCRVPRNGAACDVSATLAYPGAGDFQGRPTQVFAPAPGKVVAIGGCWNCAGGGIKERVVRWTSTDGGATFSAAEELTTPDNSGGGFDVRDGDGLLLDGENIFVAIGGDKLQALPHPANQQVVHSTFSTNYGPEVDRAPGTNTLVAATNDLDNVRYSVFTGGALSADAINTQANWSGPFDLVAPEGDNSESGLVSGPSGLFLHYRYFGATNSRMGIRRFDPATNAFGGPGYLDGENEVDDNSLDYPDATQDGSGRVHAVWRSLYDEGRLRYTVSDTTGTEYRIPGTIAARETFIDPEVGAAPDGSGFAVWEGIGQSPIRVVPLDPVVEPAIAPLYASDDKPTAKKSGKKVVVKVDGSLSAPIGTSCTGGKMKMTVRRGKKRIAKVTITVGSDCSYKATVKVKRRKVKKAKKLKVNLVFQPGEGSGLAESKVTWTVKIR